MKCVRKTGFDMTFAEWNANCKRAFRTARKKRTYDFMLLRFDVPRYRLRRKVLNQLRLSANRMLYWDTRYRLTRKYTLRESGIKCF